MGMRRPNESEKHQHENNGEEAHSQPPKNVPRMSIGCDITHIADA
jgi:hypothetical protein